MTEQLSAWRTTHRRLLEVCALVKNASTRDNGSQGAPARTAPGRFHCSVRTRSRRRARRPFDYATRAKYVERAEARGRLRGDTDKRGLLRSQHSPGNEALALNRERLGGESRAKRAYRVLLIYS